MKNLVSVIIPAYNCSKTIENTIKSVINQSYKNIEIIVVDDCSSDNTFSILEKLKCNYENMFIYRNNQNRGVAFSRNFAISCSNGQFIAFIDSDDIWLKDKIKCQLEALENFNADLCYTAYAMMDFNGNIIKEKQNIPQSISYESILKNNVILCSSVLVKRNILPEPPFKLDFFHEDMVLWLDLLKNEHKAIGINQVFVKYRLGGRSAGKFKAMKNRWIVYRKSQGIGVFKSIYYFLYYALGGFKKYYTKK